METPTFFLHILAILVTARLFAELAVRLNSPAVVGELLAGVVLGPSLLGWIEPSQIVRLLAEIGIILLLFEVGLESDIVRLARSGTKSAVVALAGFVLPFLLGFGVSSAFGLGLLPALFVGGTITATSIGITVRVLADLGRQHHAEAQIVLGAAVLDDVLGILLLALLYEFSTGGGISLGNTGRVFLFVTLFFLLAPAAAKAVSVLIHRFDAVSGIPGLIPTAIVSLVLFFAWLAHFFGAPELLGGFAAGLALSRRFFLPFGIALRTDQQFVERIEKQMQPIIHLFTPIFFVMVGLSLNLREVDWGSGFVLSFALILFVAAVAGKLLGAFLVRGSWFSRWAIGLSMVPRGEVGLIFAELGRVSGVLDNEIYAGLVFAIALTTLMPPFVLKWFYRRFEGDDIPAAE